MGGFRSRKGGVEGVEVELSELVLDGQHVQDWTFAGHQLDGVAIGMGSHLVRCDFTGTCFGTGILGAGSEQPSEFLDCVFDGCRFEAVMVGRASFVRCSFRDAVIRSWQCRQAEFIDCVFSGVLDRVVFDAALTDIHGLGGDHNTYCGNDFRYAELRQVSFQGGIDMDSQLLPTGPEYLRVHDATTVIPRVRAAVAQWSDEAARQDANRTLEVWEALAAGGQHGLLLRRDELAESPQVAERLAASLAEPT